ncbi:MAG: hypothetical protein ACRDZO_21890 [Egibacteraceae bacterium]
MTAIVILALSMMVVTVGVVVLAALQLKRAGGKLAGGVKATIKRVQPLAGELAEGGSVAATEAEALRASLERLRTVRQGEKRRGR